MRMAGKAELDAQCRGPGIEPLGGGRRIVRRIAQHEHVADIAHEGEHVGVVIVGRLDEQPRAQRRIAQSLEFLGQRQFLDLAISGAGRERMK